MDIRCSKCGEPWDMDCLHEAVEDRWPNKPWYPLGTYDQNLYDRYFGEIRQEFRRDGCKVFGGTCTATPQCDIEAISAIYDICGDDLDAAAMYMDELE